MEIPSKVPEPGFYYHYKHNPFGPVNNYAYEVLGVGCHTELPDVNMVVYRPLYPEAPVYKAGRFFDLRPLATFMEVAEESKPFRRFRKISDPVVISELEVIKLEMYGNTH